MKGKAVNSQALVLAIAKIQDILRKYSGCSGSGYGVMEIGGDVKFQSLGAPSHRISHFLINCHQLRGLKPKRERDSG